MYSSIVLVLCCSYMITQGSHLEKGWQQWKQEYSKNYSCPAEEKTRRDIWMQSYHQISQHNNGNKKFFISLNQFSDMVKIVTQNLAII